MYKATYEEFRKVLSEVVMEDPKYFAPIVRRLQEEGEITKVVVIDSEGDSDSGENEICSILEELIDISPKIGTYESPEGEYTLHESIPNFDFGEVPFPVTEYIPGMRIIYFFFVEKK